MLLRVLRVLELQCFVCCLRSAGRCLKALNLYGPSAELGLAASTRPREKSTGIRVPGSARQSFVLLDLGRLG
ncbi:hypothetical protein GQ607_000495 [Colletotrichum asianum]|uniref:Secreted protein n=1 Tax=Colletotrichum asianum TaxID=702518 RepID=A0A8H3WSR3_9PEZI|nr:hypothetical protein GQ607_000495 [Colletotrichum asianum]